MFFLNSKKSICLLLSAAIILTCGILWYCLILDNIADEVIVEAGTQPKGQYFLVRQWDTPVSLITQLSADQLTTPGSYPVKVLYRDSEYDSTLRVRDTISPMLSCRNLSVFDTQKPSPRDFVTEVQDATSCKLYFRTPPDMNHPGTQNLEILAEDLGGNKASATVKLTLIHDVEPPVIEGAADIRYFIGTGKDLLDGVTVTDDLDPDVSVFYKTDGDLTVPGTYDLTYWAEDTCKNRTEVPVHLEVIDDTDPPDIFGVYNQSVCIGSTIAYKKNIITKDDFDTQPQLTVETDQVDLSTPGTYPVIYRAIDCSGNESVAECTVTVNEKVDQWVDPAIIDEAIEKIAQQIITDGMTPKEQVEAIYDWVRYTYYYVGYSDKTDWKQNAYQMMTTGIGDCMGYYGISRMLFDYCGLPNLEVNRVNLPGQGGSHIWNMVSIDGGETYYHFDATPYGNVPVNFCLVTDADLDWFSYYYNDYFNRDRSLNPATPLEPPA